MDVIERLIQQAQKTKHGFLDIQKAENEVIDEQPVEDSLRIAKQLFTSDVAKELARDEEFIKQLLKELEKKELVVKIDKNPQGFQYSRRLRWRISNKAYEIYKKHQ